MRSFIGGWLATIYIYRGELLMLSGLLLLLGLLGALELSA